ncbi:MAG: hypothetical protein IKD52_08500 [Exiguobacterium sp.]|nr:hypothetical protein [Exiguobacterium sp.]
MINFILSKALRSVLFSRGFAESSIEDIVAKDFHSAVAYDHGIDRKIVAAFEALVEEMKTHGVDIPVDLTETILHGEEHDPQLQQLKATIVAKRMSDDERIRIAFVMIDAVHHTHQVLFGREFSNKNTYVDGVPAIDHGVVIPDRDDDMYFVPAKFAPWRIVEEHFFATEPILRAFGLHTSRQEIAEEFLNRQKGIPGIYELETVIKNGDDFPHVFRTGSAPARIAREILRENGFA